MDKKRWLLSFVLAIMTVLLVDFLFVHFLFPVKKEAILQELKENVEEEILNNPYVPVPQDPLPIPSKPDEIPRSDNSGADN
ncbi:MAG: hypothetical protein KF789_13280 [Bdellovibrionaceae bacterium]|nr:hypothetical protein [Pseudobdellovibrionaceae bacterium]